MKEYAIIRIIHGKHTISIKTEATITQEERIYIKHTCRIEATDLMKRMEAAQNELNKLIQPF